jgi:hypothetical protein
VVTRRRERGYSLLEITVMLAVFGSVLAIFFILTSEMRGWEKRLPINYMRHPQVAAVMARLRKDIVDAHVQSGPYLDEFDGFKSGDKTLIVSTVLEMGALQTVVWDFAKPGVVTRYAYTSDTRTSTWVARGLPVDFSKGVDIEAEEFEDRPFGVHIIAKDEDGLISIDQILQPRSHIPDATDTTGTTATTGT